jgi:cysteine desulfurase
MEVYLDNAATTPIVSEVIDVITATLKETFGNPSSSHFIGRKAKAIIENARRTIASTLNCNGSEIIFTGGGTEADNMAIRCCVEQLGVKHIITSEIEHHAVLHTIEYVKKLYSISVSFVKCDSKGNIDLVHLEKLLQTEEKTLVSLMHANNEIGTYLPIEKIGELCKFNNALFHSDTVQTVGHKHIDLSVFHIDFLTCSAHKIHGPKGVGFLYVNKRNKIQAFIQGGAQERGHRSGTENTAGIAGMAKALELATITLEKDTQHIWMLKQYMMQRLTEKIPTIQFNGETEIEKSLYTILNCSFPSSKNNGMLLFSLDLKGISCSGGSACTSGANTGSHVLKALKADTSRQAIRFSFSRLTTKEEIDYTVNYLGELFQ